MIVIDKKDFKKQLIYRACILAKRIIALVDKFPQKRSAWVISDQLLRAGMSIGANIIEAQASSSRKDFANFLNHSLKSANETKFWLFLSRDLDEVLNKEINEILKETEEISKILGSAIANIRGKRVK